MSTNASQHEHDERRPTRDEQIANRFAVAGLLFATGFAVYYFQVLSGDLTPPPGLIPISAAIMSVCATVKISFWAVDRRLRRIEADRAEEMAELRDLVTELRALTAQLSAGSQTGPSVGLDPEVIELGRRVTDKINGAGSLQGRRPAR